jgi:hypothetical protein
MYPRSRLGKELAHRLVLIKEASEKSEKSHEMRVVKPWVTALQIDEGTFASWIAKVPKHESITFWCLDKGHVRLNDYFNWAMNHYGLPFLKADYFGTPANRDLWSKIQSVANWSPELLPLEEWDGTIFVACVEPPEDIRWSFPVQYILASPQDLKMQWERLNSEPTMVSSRHLMDEATSPGIAPPPVQPPPALVPPPAVQAPALTLSVPNTSSIAPPPPPSEFAVADVPDGLKIDAPEGFKLNLNLPPSDAAQTPAPAAAEPDSPAGLNLNLGGGKVLSLDNLSPQDEVVTGVGPNPLSDDKTSPIEAVPEGTGSGFVLVQQEQQKVPVGDTSGAIDSDRIAPSTLEAAKSETEAIAWVFQQLKQYFRHSWLLTLSNGTLKVWRWDSSAKIADAGAVEPIDLNQPSLFRIVSRTAMPYHGHVVDSPTNTGFFKLWGLRTAPSHVTAVPLTSDGHLVAILLCSGEKPTQPDQVLRFTEKMGLAITSNLGKKAAAA